MSSPRTVQTKRWTTRPRLSKQRCAGCSTLSAEGPPVEHSYTCQTKIAPVPALARVADMEVQPMCSEIKIDTPTQPRGNTDKLVVGQRTQSTPIARDTRQYPSTIKAFHNMLLVERTKTLQKPCDAISADIEDPLMEAMETDHAAFQREVRDLLANINKHAKEKEESMEADHAAFQREVRASLASINKHAKEEEESMKSVNSAVTSITQKMQALASKDDLTKVQKNLASKDDLAEVRKGLEDA
ncbi:hypothetical protein P171DRAFT_31886 [Karstenula rhodostoma CBS 690.94]|uniref:Uncharacterized protein n=1 Tax=Karstenula rhodostoma CBS 690.94 TaxID=1392251 RepID=A0A9P4UCP6_9PLEO|nr:hypothetical protein P171DRAFT_31886 [Karstenula rhodostoma CBS 690.94]